MELPLRAPGAAEIPSPAVKVSVPSALSGGDVKEPELCVLLLNFSELRRAWIGGDFKDHLIPSPCCGQGSHPLNQVAQSPTQPGLDSPLSLSFLQPPCTCTTCTGLLFRTSRLVLVISRTHIPQCTIRLPLRKPSPQKKREEGSWRAHHLLQPTLKQNIRAKQAHIS